MQQSLTTIVGSLVADPEIRVGATGTAYTTVRVAATRRSPDAAGVWADRSTAFLDIKLFKNLCANVCESLRRGDEVIATGQLVTEEWTTGEGDKRSKTVMIADAMGASLTRATARVTKVARSTGAPASEDPTDDDAIEVPADASSLTAETEPAF